MRRDQEARISSLENRIAEGNQALQEAKQLAAQVKFDAEIAKDSPLQKGKELDRLVIQNQAVPGQLDSQRGI